MYAYARQSQAEDDMLCGVCSSYIRPTALLTFCSWASTLLSSKLKVFATAAGEGRGTYVDFVRVLDSFCGVPQAAPEPAIGVNVSGTELP